MLITNIPVSYEYITEEYVYYNIVSATYMKHTSIWNSYDSLEVTEPFLFNNEN